MRPPAAALSFFLALQLSVGPFDGADAFLVHRCSFRDRATMTRISAANKNSSGSTTAFSKIAKFLFKEITEDINDLTGKEKWEPGDLLRWMNKKEYKYEFGDLTKWAAGFAAEQAADYAGLDTSKGGKYGNVADFGSSLVTKVRTGAYQTEDIYMALKVMLAAGSGMGMLKNLPVPWIMQLIDAGISKDDDSELMEKLSTNLEDRIGTAMKDGGDAEKKVVSLVKDFTGKEKYSVGDIAKVIMEQAKDKDTSSPRTLELTKIVKDIKDWDEKKLDSSE